MNRLKSVIIVLSATFFFGCNMPLFWGEIVVSKDEMEGIEWYRASSSLRAYHSKNIHAYIGKQGSNVWLRFRMTYSANNWLFVKSVLFKIDDETYELKYSFLDDWERDSSSYGSVWEWKDVSVDKNIWRIINKISESQKTMMRYRGDQYISDRKISNEEKLALKTIISKYKEMGGEPPED